MTRTTALPLLRLRKWRSPRRSVTTRRWVPRPDRADSGGNRHWVRTSWTGEWRPSSISLTRKWGCRDRSLWISTRRWSAVEVGPNRNFKKKEKRALWRRWNLNLQFFFWTNNLGEIIVVALHFLCGSKNRFFFFERKRNGCGFFGWFEVRSWVCKVISFRIVNVPNFLWAENFRIFEWQLAKTGKHEFWGPFHFVAICLDLKWQNILPTGRKYFIFSSLSCESNKKVSKTWAMFGWDAEDGKHAELKWAKGANWLVTKLNHFVMLVFRFLLYSWRWQFRFSLSCSVCLELWNPSYVAGRCSPFPV